MKYSIEFQPPTPSENPNHWFYAAERYLESLGRTVVGCNSHTGVIIMEGKNIPRIKRVRVRRLLDAFATNEPPLPPKNEEERVFRQRSAICERFN